MNAAKEFLNSPELITVYENLQKLDAAVWVLLMARETLIAESEQKEEISVSNVRLYNLDRETLPLHQQMLPDLVSVVIKEWPTTYAIYYLGCKPGTHNTAFLLVLTADHEEGEALSLGTMLEESCRPTDKGGLITLSKGRKIGIGFF